MATRPHRSAWDKQKGLSADEAKSKYVEHFLSILDKDGSEASQKLKAEVSGSLRPFLLPQISLARARSTMWLWTGARRGLERETVHGLIRITSRHFRARRQVLAA